VAKPGVAVSGGVKANWGKPVAAGEPMGVSEGSDGVKVEAVCIATSVLAASVEYTETICVADVEPGFPLVAAYTNSAPPPISIKTTATENQSPHLGDLGELEDMGVLEVIITS
jgi:hypothetical protein